MANFYGDLANQVGSDDESQISDVDPSQLAKMVEDVDDLDADLFGSSFNKKQEKPSSTKSVVKSALKSPSLDTNSERPQKSHVTFDSTEKSSSFQKSDSKKYVKKNIDFGDFDADDPLGDLLSDDDDSDNYSNRKKKTDIFKSDASESNKKQELIPDTPESKNKPNKAKVIADLFGLEEEKKQVQQTESEKDVTSGWLGLKDSKSAESKPPATSKPNSKTAEHVTERTATKKPNVTKRIGGGGGDDEDGGDLLAGMGFGGERHGNPGNHPKSKLDDLLGKSTSGSEDIASRSMLDDLLGKKTPSRERLAAGDGKRNLPQQAQQPTSGVSFGSYSPSVTAPGRRHGARRNSGTSTLPDPLGIFTPTPSPTKENPGRQLSSSNPGHKIADWLGISDARAPSPTARVDSPERRQRVTGGEQPLPDWLGGRATVTVEQTHRPTQPQSLPQVPVPVPAAVSANPAAVPANPAAVPSMPTVVPPVPSTPAPVSSSLTGSGIGVLATGSQMDQQVVAALQHQEMQLLTALHLKQHEERQSALQVRQQEMLQRQEQQLEQLIHRQMERQEQLDVHMRSQQERISAHIQLLLAQPVTNPAVSIPVATTSKVQPSFISTIDQNIDESSGEKEKAENKHVESTLESLKAKHLEEMQLLEDSYKRQIVILETSSERQAERLRNENDRLEKEYESRMERIKEEQTSLVEQQQLKLAAQQKEHLEELQQLRELHRQNLEEARKQHSDMLEHLNRARTFESNALKEASSYSRSLQTALEQLGRNSQDLGGLQMELSSQHHSHLDTREVALQARESELKVARESLEKQRKASEEERKRLVGLVSQLEQKLSEQRQNTEEERWNLRQEATRLDAATKTLEKERERVMQQNDRERQQLQNLKESMLSEQKLLSEQLQQEKLNLASEKSRFETMARLHGVDSPELSKMRAELEAGLQVAQEAGQQAEAEREKLRSRQHRLDEERRRLEDFERDLTSRARELETLTEMAVATKEEGRRALEEARRMDQQRSVRAADIQRQLNELREREKRLAQEKVLLSQERLTLQHQKGRDLCSYCRRPTVILSPPPTPPDLDKKFVDPKLIIMKLAAEDEASRLEQESRFFSSQFSASK